jgi:hypothetical protein
MVNSQVVRRPQIVSKMPHESGSRRLGSFSNRGSDYTPTNFFIMSGLVLVGLLTIIRLLAGGLWWAVLHIYSQLE